MIQSALPPKVPISSFNPTTSSHEADTTSFNRLISSRISSDSDWVDVDTCSGEGGNEMARLRRSTGRRGGMFSFRNGDSRGGDNVFNVSDGD